MSILRKVLPILLVALGVAALHPAARGLARTDAPAATDVGFGDPAHPVFFRYQDYLTRTGAAGETPKTWAALAPAERAKRLADGESKLETLRAELSAKPALTPEETALVRAVWGADVGAAPRAAPAAGTAAAPARKVATAAAKISATRDWDRAFDGGARSIDIDGAVNASGRARPKPAALAASAPAAGLRGPDGIAVPPVSGGEETPLKKTLPFAAGLAALAAAYFAAGGLGGKSAGPEAAPLAKGPYTDPEFPTIRRTLGRADDQPKSVLADCDCTCTCKCTDTCGCTANCDCTCTCKCTDTCGCTSNCDCTCTCKCTDTCGCTANCDCTCTCKTTCGCTSNG